MKSRQSSRLVASLLFVIAGVWGVPSFAITKDFDRTYSLQPGGSVELQNVNGAVEVQVWDRPEVEILAVKTAKSHKSDLERVAIDVDAKPGAISVTTRYPQDEGVEVAVDYTIHMPHGARLENLATVNGTLRIAGVDAIGKLHTVNGNIEVYEGAGAVHARSTNGNIHLELRRLQAGAGATAETTNGSLLLALPSDTQADLEARCLNGKFFSEFPIAMESSLHPREVRGTLGKGGPPIQLRTVNGGIHIILLKSTI
jgi:DUF4097 and DUF4098 domain-containing protein YvlB